LTWYEVLTQLAEAPEKKLRLGHLSEKLQISKSNVTRLVDGIEGAGFLAREPGRQDRRVVWAVLTTAGLATITRATSTYASGIGQGQRQALPDIASWGNCWDELVTLLSKHPGATGAQELIMGLVTSLRETAGIEPDSVPAPTHHG
jgi:DNA-binding MarR family transcriptional regulator